jgi:hypothetical protein
MRKTFDGTRQAVFAAMSALVCMVADGSANNANAATPITITAGKTVITATLNDSPTAQDFIKSLPVVMKMTRWGEREYFGKVRERLSDKGRKQNSFENGDVAYWVPGGSFAIFFNNKVNPDISDLIVIGKISSDLKVFDAMDPSVEMRIGIAK